MNSYLIVAVLAKEISRASANIAICLELNNLTRVENTHPTNIPVQFFKTVPIKSELHCDHVENTEAGFSS